MRRSQAKTKVAQLRIALGISAEEFARYIGRSVDTVRSLESGRLALSKPLAGLIHEMMGVRVSWLLDDEITGPPLGTDGKAMTSETMLDKALTVQRDLHNFSTEQAKEIYPKRMADTLEAILRDAGEHPRFHVAIYYTARFLNKLEQEFIPPKTARRNRTIYEPY